MRKGFFVLVLVLAVIIAGCKGGGDKRVSSASTPFIGGIEGLRVSFLENAPPKEVLDNPKPGTTTEVMKFDIILKVDNVGEQDVAASSLKTTIGGIFPADFGKATTDLKDVIFAEKKKADLSLSDADAAKLVLSGVKKDPEGDKILGSIDELTFKGLAYLKQLEGNTEFPIQADICYKYATKAVGDFCMRQDITKTISGVCQVNGAKPVFSSGAPIHVVSLDESVGGITKVILKFKIKVVGSGSFFKPDVKPDVAADCTRGDFAKENVVRVTVKSGVQDLTCSGLFGSPPTGNVRLSNGEASVTCIQDNVNIDAVQKVNLQIEYNHLISASTKVLVKHLPEFGGGIGTGTTTASCADYGTIPASGQSCCAGNSPCSYCGGTCYISCPNSLCQGTTGATCVSGTDCVSGSCSDKVCAAPISLTGCSSPQVPKTAQTYDSYKTNCAATASGGAWDETTAEGCCKCPTGKTWPTNNNGCVSQVSAGAGASSSRSPSLPKAHDLFNTYKDRCPLGGGTWSESDSNGYCTCPSGKVWDESVKACR